MSSMAAVRAVRAVTRVCCTSSCYKAPECQLVAVVGPTAAAPARPPRSLASKRLPVWPVLLPAACVDIKSASRSLDPPDVATCKALGSDAPRPGQCGGASVADDHG